MKKKKQHASEYLSEYKAKKETPNWLSLLIQKAVDSNGKISDENKSEIYTELLKENKIDVKKNVKDIKESESVADQEETEIASTNQKLTLQKITHLKGVNALIPNQAITLSPACTVIFGLNGTGKSGYFRIIHELSGGAKSKDILDNIHKQGNGLEVDIDFLLDDKKQKSYKWQDKKLRGIAPFNKVKVFDSEYLPIFLNERESSVNIEPLGLNLFQVIATVVDEFKEEMAQYKQQEESRKPDLQVLIDIIHSGELKLLLQKSSLLEKERQHLDGNSAFSDEELAMLTQLRQDKVSLEKNNTLDSRKVLNQEKKEIDALRHHLGNLKINLEAFTKNISITIVDYFGKKKTRDERAKQFAVLKNIPSQNTEEWQVFIESAKVYGTTIEQTIFNKDEKCIYCHQPLGEEAIKLVQAYSQYLNDQSQQNFRNVDDKISEIKTEVDNLETDFIFSENLENSLKNENNEQWETYKALADQVLEEADRKKVEIIKAIKDKVSISDEYVLDLLKVDEKLDELSEKKKKEIDDLQQSDTKKTQKISQLEIEINKLEDKQNISKWKTKIENYFLSCRFIQKYSSVNDLISTRGITELGSRAHGELLTDSIRKSFEDELKALGKDIEVSLEKTSAGKGTIRRRLKILGNDVRAILSDGEQKSVGLALFLAEVESQNKGCPIVFDDPVTSVDHEVADFLAQKLLKISLDRQIIIFTHNRLFYDSLVYWGNNLKDNKNSKTHHVCKNYISKGCNSTGSHVYTYKVDRESKDRTGRIFEAQNESCSYFIEKAENEIKGDYPLSSVSSYLKSAIEYFIDEKVLNNQELIKDQKIKDHIEWDRLKEIKPDIQTIGQLKNYWDQLSSRGSHLSANSQENPLKLEELKEIINYINSKL